jgi:hypothetical protein
MFQVLLDLAAWPGGFFTSLGRSELKKLKKGLSDGPIL